MEFHTSLGYGLLAVKCLILKFNLFLFFGISLQIHYSTSKSRHEKKLVHHALPQKLPLDDKLVFSESFFPRKKNEGWGELCFIHYKV